MVHGWLVTGYAAPHTHTVTFGSRLLGWFITLAFHAVGLLVATFAFGWLDYLLVVVHLPFAAGYLFGWTFTLAWLFGCWLLARFIWLRWFVHTVTVLVTFVLVIWLRLVTFCSVAFCTVALYVYVAVTRCARTVTALVWLVLHVYAVTHTFTVYCWLAVILVVCRTRGLRLPRCHTHGYARLRGTVAGWTFALVAVCALCVAVFIWLLAFVCHTLLGWLLHTHAFVFSFHTLLRAFTHTHTRWLVGCVTVTLVRYIYPVLWLYVYTYVVAL